MITLFFCRRGHVINGLIEQFHCRYFTCFLSDERLRDIRWLKQKLTPCCLTLETRPHSLFNLHPVLSCSGPFTRMIQKMRGI
jgi:hypothetical protein